MDVNRRNIPGVIFAESERAPCSQFRRNFKSRRPFISNLYNLSRYPSGRLPESSRASPCKASPTINSAVARNYRNSELRERDAFARLQENFKPHPSLIRDIIGALADRKNRVTGAEQRRSIPKRKATMKGDEAGRRGGHFRGSWKLVATG
ncbi:hypothetical protein K0M31_007463 [Melipona bicolor]|uniref:Uncharacterized protein n=1 Tax=Melipona bicolor TaxID=60889 RepID=A0AA40KW08_9HYME|nr:hypothetical protein K0M31_007463 [Melipona bicolor]